MNENVANAVERLDGAFTMNGVIAHGDDWMEVRAYLLEVERNAARYRAAIQRHHDAFSDEVLDGDVALWSVLDDAAAQDDNA